MSVNDEGTSRYRAGSRLVSSTAIGALLAAGDVLVLAALTWTFSAYKNGAIGPGFLISWHALVVVSAVVVINYVVGLYQLARVTQVRELCILILAAAGTTALAMAMVVYVTAGWEDNLGPLGRIVLGQSLTVFAIWELASRFVALQWIRRRSGEARWLILGSQGPSAKVLAKLLDAPEFAHRTLLLPVAGQEPADGAWSELPTQLARPWTGIILAQDQPLPDELVELLMQAKLGGARVVDLTDLFEQLRGCVPLERIDRGWFLTSDGFDIAHSRNGLRLKRLMDLWVSLLLLILALPVALGAGLAVTLTSRGPVFYSQKRVGRRGRTFIMYKFRTMRTDAEAAGAQWAAARDPRITSVGRVMRALRIDELPQLWNILRGEMSFIGPRPERPEFTATLEASIPFYALRHLVKPGLTGWAQICFPYGASIEESRQKLEFDLYYIKNHSLALDLMILVRTVRVVIHRQGAR